MNAIRIFLVGALACAPFLALAKGNAARGERIARENCARCHAVGRAGASPNPKAPHFRELARRYPLQNLEEALAEGVVVAHEGAQMPEFQLGVAEIDNLIAYLRAIQAGRRR
jgi:mono/diheme cytochrome c family protein